MTTHKRQIRGAVVLGLLAVTAFVTPAHAGTQLSPQCSDNVAGPNATEIHILDTPITFNLEAGPSPTYLVVCYSTTPRNDGSTALTGGYIHVTPNGVTCIKDWNPLLLGVDCQLRDDNTSSPGRTLSLTLHFQNVSTTIEAGVEVGAPARVACLKNTTVYTPVGTFPFASIGACT